MHKTVVICAALAVIAIIFENAGEILDWPLFRHKCVHRYENLRTIFCCPNLSVGTARNPMEISVQEM